MTVDLSPAAVTVLEEMLCEEVPDYSEAVIAMDKFTDSLMEGMDRLRQRADAAESKLAVAVEALEVASMLGGDCPPTMTENEFYWSQGLRARKAARAALAKISAPGAGQEEGGACHHVFKEKYLGGQLVGHCIHCGEPGLGPPT